MSVRKIALTSPLVIAAFAVGVFSGRLLYRPRARVEVRSVPLNRFQVYATPGNRVCGLEKDATISLNHGYSWEDCAKRAVVQLGNR